MHAIPAQAQRELVRAQLARVEQAEHLDAREVARQSSLELLGAVLVHVPGVVRARRRPSARA